MMSDVGVGTGTKKQGGVKVGVKEKEAVKVSPKEKERFEVEWRVLLHNDEVHTFDYVSRKLAEVSELVSTGGACVGGRRGGRGLRCSHVAGWLRVVDCLPPDGGVFPEAAHRTV